MPYHTNLARILRDAGLKVIEQPGWQSRGHGPMGTVQGVMWHHTATSASAAGNFPSLNIVTNGRSDLPGPLCNLGLGRDGTWYVIAAGLAYHAGSGSYPGITHGNTNTIGIEAEHPGTPGHPWPAEQLDSYRRGTAALLKAFGLGSDRLMGHKEYAPGRKIDPYGLDMPTERRIVQGLMTNPPKNAGGIEEMAFNDTFKDWAGNQQSVLSWMNNIDKRIAQLHYIFLSPGSEPSRIPGDKNRTNLRDAIMDNTAWTNRILGLVAAGSTDPQAVADALKPVITSVVKDAVAAALGEDNAAQADAIVNEITRRLGGEAA